MIHFRIQMLVTIAEGLEERLAYRTKSSPYITKMSDGAMNRGIFENEVVSVWLAPSVQYLSEPHYIFMGLVPVEHARAEGVTDAIVETFKNISLHFGSFLNKLMGLMGQLLIWVRKQLCKQY